MSDIELNLDICEHLDAKVRQTGVFRMSETTSTVIKVGAPLTITARCAACDADDKPMERIWSD